MAAFCSTVCYYYFNERYYSFNDNKINVKQKQGNLPYVHDIWNRSEILIQEIRSQSTCSFHGKEVFLVSWTQDELSCFCLISILYLTLRAVHDLHISADFREPTPSISLFMSRGFRRGIARFGSRYITYTRKKQYVCALLAGRAQTYLSSPSLFRYSWRAWQSRTIFFTKRWSSFPRKI